MLLRGSDRSLLHSSVSLRTSKSSRSPRSSALPLRSTRAYGSSTSTCCRKLVATGQKLNDSRPFVIRQGKHGARRTRFEEGRCSDHWVTSQTRDGWPVEEVAVVVDPEVPKLPVTAVIRYHKTNQSDHFEPRRAGPYNERVASLPVRWQSRRVPPIALPSPGKGPEVVVATRLRLYQVVRHD